MRDRNALDTAEDIKRRIHRGVLAYLEETFEQHHDSEIQAYINALMHEVEKLNPESKYK